MPVRTIRVQNTGTTRVEYDWFAPVYGSDLHFPQADTAEVITMPDPHMAHTRPLRQRHAGDDPADVELLDRVAQGDVGAFEALFRRYRPRLRRFLGFRTGHPELVDEMVNDTMLVVWRRARSFDLESRASTWIIGIALRIGLKASRVRPPWEALDLEAAADASGIPERQVAHKELQASLRDALRLLSPDHRAVIELAYFHGSSCREIAQALDCPQETVKTRMFYARRRLKVLLAHLAEDAA
jgi:RNA polymerase sigma-70 factor (ECF subfamily)